jgi:hypothetical protein
MTDSATDSFAAEALSQPVLRRIVDYWIERAAGRPMPTRADIDPVPQRPSLVPFLSLVELRPPPRRFFFRVFGGVAFEHRHDLVPRNLAWRYLEDVPVHNRKEDTLAAFARAADSGRPAYLAWTFETAIAGATASFAAALLPLGADGRTTHLLVGTYYSDTQHLMLAARNQGAPSAAAA